MVNTPTKSTPRSKRAKTAGASSSAPPPNHDPRFRSLEHEEYIKTNILRRKLVQDRNFEIQEGTYPQFEEEIQRRGWDLFTTCAGNGWKEITQEFFTNAMRIKSDTFPPRHSMVRGKLINFTPSNIKRVLNIPVVHKSAGQLDFTTFSIQEDKDYKPILETVCKEGENWEFDCKMQPKNLTTKHLIPAAKIWSVFILSSFMPVLHSSTLAVKRAELIYAILTGMPIHVGEVISSAIMDIMSRSRDSMGFPSIIAMLCQDTGVDFGDYLQKIRVAPPITTAMVKDFFKPRKNANPGLSLPADYRRDTPMRMREQMKQLALRQDSIHAGQKALMTLMDTMLLNMGKKLGMTTTQLYEAPTFSAPYLRVAVQSDLPPFPPPAPTRAEADDNSSNTSDYDLPAAAEEDDDDSSFSISDEDAI